MNYLSQSKENFKNKICLVRVDLNIEKGDEKNSLKLKVIKPTVDFLTSRGAKVLLLSHRGRPLKNDSSQSLFSLAKFLNRHQFKNQPIRFINNFNLKNIKKRIRSAKPGSVFLLENLRFLSGEQENNSEFAKKLAGLGDFYINDAFAVNHRANASIAAITKFIKPFAGLQLEKEIKNLNGLLKKIKRPLVFILGGAKAEDKIMFLQSFFQKSDYFMLGGGIANTFLAAQKLPVGDSIYDKKSLEFLRKTFLNSQNKLQKIIQPVDYLIHNRQILDIGPKTIDLYSRYIKMAKTIVWNGPLGLIEKKEFAAGTNAIARMIANSKAFSIVGGGETADLIIKLRLDKKIIFLSTGGGAMLEYLSGKPMPGIDAIK
ncbi:MAG: phosphoglycerate kinase [Candidatus Brennerbacteria bacterium]|nr:phosphoglycerate kinase [Candidatus Brennerbacteria bacterium]